MVKANLPSALTVARKDSEWVFMAVHNLVLRNIFLPNLDLGKTPLKFSKTNLSLEYPKDKLLNSIVFFIMKKLKHFQ